MTSTTCEAGPRLEALRRAQGVAVLPLSKATNIPREALTKFLKGEGDLKFSRVMIVARELGAPKGWLDGSTNELTSVEAICALPDEEAIRDASGRVFTRKVEGSPTTNPNWIYWEHAGEKFHASQINFPAVRIAA